MRGKKVTFVMHMGCDIVMSTPTLKIANRENRNQQPNILKTPTSSLLDPSKSREICEPVKISVTAKII